MQKRLDPYITQCEKINSKWIKEGKKRIKDLNIRTKTIKLLEENIGVDLCDTELGNGFLDMTPKAQETKEKINWNSSKLKTFVLQRTPSKREQVTQETEKISANHVSDKGSVFRTNREHL